ncbi:type VII secretion target [Nocardia grenadensis]|uniref:type VII secretion target n=1 Tax=Nocardia grenadensis TaxID=931537 RepID=UPI0007A392E9|nr:type VII secretion target [Nocardia grenadensis]
MAEDLSVRPEDLDGLATTLNQLAAENTRAESYIRDHIDLSSDQAGLMYGRVAETIQQVRESLETNYSTLGNLTSTSSDELTRTAQMYRTTDGSTAAALDKTYPGKK